MQLPHAPLFTHETLAPAQFGFGFGFVTRRSFFSSTERGLGRRIGRLNHLRVCCSVSNGWGSGIGSESYELRRKRKIVEHICLLKAKDDLSDEQEKDMLDYLYTSQYQMGGIIATTLGRIENQNPDGYTHAVFMRFQRKEDIARFYQNSSYLGVLENHVMPHCHVLTNVDYESEVEDDILPIFRKGEDFNYGVEYMILIAIDENAPREQIDDALGDLEKLEVELPSLIVQCTQGANLNISDSEYTHAAVVRFRSAEAFNMFLGDSKYRDIWASKFQPITQKALAVHFPVDPVATEIM